ncbi:hypothetical protein COS80_00965 [Candidatus Woesebacteria bacterium CG06_land_8_20_14_3_00_39_27]|uniref:Uncharacterized protein n=2 Tax=Candidatus Woeseibacteriota TaxID=1752722 RepID=A0A2M7AQF3_9BACT|nr:MAG: hypothetical protein COS80_00965 [Candidatus Woesebacteria bacterium CG06_land_8_20_14_3_00_39_27]
MKKRLIILIILILTIFMAIVLSRPKTKPTPSPTPTPSPKGGFYPNEPNLQDSAQQIQDALKYGQSLKELNQKYPWYSKLPIETKDYRIIYDFDKEMFRIRIKSAVVATEGVKSDIQSALSDLKKIGVSEPIKYYVLDVNGNQL